MMPPVPRRPLALLVAALSAVALGACSSQSIVLDEGETANVERGAILFAERCAGCHTFEVTGSEGSATSIHDRERVDGPNFDTRCVSAENALYAIRNGGYSGAIMPENIVVGQDADDIAEFLEKYAGRDVATGC
jgi:mono/diheme cytochrome c family protein